MKAKTVKRMVSGTAINLFFVACCFLPHTDSSLFPSVVQE